MHFGSTLSHLWKTLPSASGAGHDIGEADRWELMMDRKWWRARTNWNSHLALTASNFDDAGDLQEKLALCTLQLLTTRSRIQRSKRPGSGGAGGVASAATAPCQDGASAGGDSMPQCLLTCPSAAMVMPFLLASRSGTQSSPVTIWRYHHLSKGSSGKQSFSSTKLTQFKAIP